MDQAYDNGMVQVEQFARRGTQASRGVLTKVLFCDMIRALHETVGIPSVDLGNCYDAVAHPIASIALQAFQVPLATIVLSLSVLRTMTFFLRTGFGAPAAIPLRCVTDAEVTLGVWSCPAGDFGVHVSKKMAEGHLWVERLRRNRCPPGDARMGFRYSLIPFRSFIVRCFLP
jgi:hypothetical protein